MLKYSRERCLSLFKFPADAKLNLCIQSILVHFSLFLDYHWLHCFIITTKQEKTKKGDDQYSILYPKYKKGDFIVRKFMEESDYGWYVKELMSELLVVHASGTDSNSDLTVPDFLCSEFDRPDKKAIIEKQTSLCNDFLIVRNLKRLRQWMLCLFMI